MSVYVGKSTSMSVGRWVDDRIGKGVGESKITNFFTCFVRECASVCVCVCMCKRVLYVGMCESVRECT